MKLEAGKEMDRKCVLDWLNKVYIAPSLSYSEYTDDEIRIFAHDALVLLKEQDELLHKLQKDKDKLCLDVSEWKHKYHDRPLKEQEAVEPITEHHLFLCPVCKNTLFTEQKFCHECGKHIDWEGQ